MRTRLFAAGGAAPGQFKALLGKIVLFPVADGEAIAAAYAGLSAIHLLLHLEAVLAKRERRFLEDKFPVVGVDDGLAAPGTGAFLSLVQAVSAIAIVEIVLAKFFPAETAFFAVSADNFETLRKNQPGFRVTISEFARFE